VNDIFFEVSIVMKRGGGGRGATELSAHLDPFESVRSAKSRSRSKKEQRKEGRKEGRKLLSLLSTFTDQIAHGSISQLINRDQPYVE